MKFLVTGGAGFIGSHIVGSLIEEGHIVTVVDDESADSNRFWWNKNATNHKISINCYDCLPYLMKDIDVVFHLAAESRVQICSENPVMAAKTNVVGICNVLEAAKKVGVKRVIYSSTSSAYGLNKSPNNENNKVDCINPYASTKVAGELLCKNYSDLFGLETVIFRYFNVYGDRSPVKGQYAPLVGRFLDQYKKGELLTIVPDGSQRRDYIHVSDVVEANMIAAFKKNIKSGEIYNVGSGINYSVSEIADMISDKQRFIDPRDGEAQETLANINKIKKDFKWNPKVNLKEWIEEKLTCIN
tara:strand:- start:663 stop:1562 length:900 start_codon:yes stop_codon:yes gene_type:complete